MSAKCYKCGLPIFDEDAQCYGTQLPDGRWACDNAEECAEMAQIRAEEESALSEKMEE